MIVALAIAGLLLGVVPMVATKFYESVEYRATVRSVLGALRSARERAAAEGRPVRFELDLGGRRYGEAGRPSVPFPEAYRIGATLAATERDDRGIGGIRFFPDGGSTGGSITITRPGGQGVRLRVDWLFGRITQEDPGGAES